jgi:hypothetical protein
MLVAPSVTGGIFKCYYDADFEYTSLTSSLYDQFTSDPLPYYLVSIQTPPGLEIAGTGDITITSGGNTYGPFSVASDTASAMTYVFKTPIPINGTMFSVSGGDGGLNQIYFNASAGTPTAVGFPLTLVADTDHQSAGVGGGTFTFLDWSGSGSITLTLKEYEQNTGQVTVSGAVPSGVNVTIGVLTGYDPGSGDPILAAGSVTLTTAQPSATITYSGSLFIEDNSTNNNNVFIVIS